MVSIPSDVAYLMKDIVAAVESICLEREEVS